MTLLYSAVGIETLYFLLVDVYLGTSFRFVMYEYAQWQCLQFKKGIRIQTNGGSQSYSNVIIHIIHIMLPFSILVGILKRGISS